MGRDGRVVRLTTLQPLAPAGSEGGGAVDAKRQKTATTETGAGEEQEQEEEEEEVSVAMKAQRAMEELGAAGGWGEGVRAR